MEILKESQDFVINNDNLEDEYFNRKNKENENSKNERKETNDKIIIDEDYLSFDPGKEENDQINMCSSMFHKIYKDLINIKIPRLNSEINLIFENGLTQNHKIPPFKITSRKIKSMNYLKKFNGLPAKTKTYNDLINGEMYLK